MRILFLMTFLLVTGCASVDSQNFNKPYPKVTLNCGDDQIQWCEGRTPNNMECTCVRRRELERAFRNSNFMW